MSNTDESDLDSLANTVVQSSVEEINSTQSFDVSIDAPFMNVQVCRLRVGEMAAFPFANEMPDYFTRPEKCPRLLGSDHVAQ